MQRLGSRLDSPLPAGAATPGFGETAGEQRRYTVAQYIEMWEKEQGRTLNAIEKDTIARGCIGITANNIFGAGDPPLDQAYGTFDQAHKVITTKNTAIEWMVKTDPLMASVYGTKRYIMFAKLFWSNQSKDPAKRRAPSRKAFLPDPRTGRVDMSKYAYRRQPGFVNFDYGFWDEASQSFWHANHSEDGDPADPMKVLQSTKEKFAHKLTVAGTTRYGYRDFDRVVYAVALAENYDPGLAAIATATAVTP